ncbi:MAG TPA: hypothetical protein VGS19_17115 [Streptosporangiaceae bacterium]|nr:hypothetical protein [Streptosporangiaceae bacterium]
MQSPPRAGPPPYVPLRHSRWPTVRTPRWLFLAGLAVVVCAVLIGIAVHPTRGQRATDMDGFLHDMTTGIESCAGGVGESLTVLHAIEAGTSHDVATAVSVAAYGAANCSVANNQPLADMTQYQVQESLARFHLDRVVTGLQTWAAPDAQRVQSDVAAVLRAQGAARAADTARLNRDLRAMDGERAYVDKIMNAAVAATGATAKLPNLPG